MVIKAPNILLPKEKLYEWSCVACDQYTSEPHYWETLDRLVSDSPSTLRITFPEVYLGKDDDKRIADINRTMQEYIHNDVFRPEIEGYVLVERTIGEKTRLGLMIAVDLESYDFTPFADVKIKATEKTILDRIPPRVKIRENAPLELPHIMLLADDRDGVLIENIYSMKDNFELLYDTDLNMNGGHIKGWLVNDNTLIDNAIAILDDEKTKIGKYSKKTNFLFAVGDGNHSLATAKACWDKIKATNPDSPSRYALCELVNIYDNGLEFEPIHRAIFEPSDEFISKLIYLSGDVRFRTVGIYELMVSGSSAEIIAKIQTIIEESLLDGSIKGVDYIHGEESLFEVCSANRAIGIIMPKISKDELFGYILNEGLLPKKAFSMGNANEKRYYMEARIIK